MSEETFSSINQGAAKTVSEPLTIIVPSGALNTQTNTSLSWFYPFLPQTFAGTVSGGYAIPTASGNGYGGSNNNGFVFQNGQYNTKREGSGQ